MNLAEKIAPTHTALLVVDIQKDFAAPEGLLGQRGRDLSMVPGMLSANHALIAAAQTAGVLTVYAQQIFDRTKLTPLQLEQYDLDGKMITADIAGEGWHFHGITPPQDKVFIKYNYNAFSNPDLHTTLQSHGIKTLIITGMDTHICVETAIRNGFDLGYKIVVPADAVACNGRHLDLHNRTLQLTEKIYGTVTTTPQILSLWQQ